MAIEETSSDNVVCKKLAILLKPQFMKTVCQRQPPWIRSYCVLRPFWHSHWHTHFLSVASVMGPRKCWSIRMPLNHWGRVAHICISELIIIGSDNGLSPGRHQAIIWTNAGILLIRTLGTNVSEILGIIHSFSFSKMHLKMSSAKWRVFGLSLNELTLQMLRSEQSGQIWSIPWLPMPWFLASPGHQQPWYWLLVIWILQSSIRVNFNNNYLTHWGCDIMAIIFQMTFWKAFSWMQMYEFRLKFHWKWFLRFQLRIFQHWFR